MSLLNRLFAPAASTDRAPSSARGTDPRAVPRDNTSLLVKRGWRQTGKTYSGPYACKFGTWHGHLEKRGDLFTVWIKDPPEAVRSHPKFICFHNHDDKGWWRIHLQRQPIDGDPSAIINYVETVLIESFRLIGRT